MSGFPSSMVEGATKKQNDAQPIICKPDPGEKCLKLNSLHHKQQDALLEPYSVSHYVDDQLVSVLSTAGRAHVLSFMLMTFLLCVNITRV